MLNAPFSRFAVFGLSLLLPASVGWGDVKVTHKPVEVEHKTFDPAKPPKELGLEKEGAVTVSEFDLRIGLGIEPGDKRQLRNGKWQQSMVIQRVSLSVGLKITVWLPENANAKLTAHEEGHVLMTEKVYAERADQAAKAAGAVIDGRRMTAEADSSDGLDKAFEETMGEANKKVYPVYLSKTADVSARAGDIYDDITKHGTRMDIDEKTAAAQAFAREAAEELAATTKPAAATKSAGTRVEQGPMKMSPK